MLIYILILSQMNDKKIKLFDDLVKIKENKDKERDNDEIINKVIDLLETYQGETRDYSLEQFVFRFTHIDAITDYVKSMLNDYWLKILPNLIGEVRDFDDRYYIITAYGDVAPVFSGDVDDRLDDIFYVLKGK